MTHPASTPAAARGRRLLREFGAALVLVVAVVVFVINQRWHRARLEVAAAVAEADQLDPGWRFEDMEAQRRLPPPERNSALQVLKVKSLIPERWPYPPLGPGGREPPEMDLWRDNSPLSRDEEPARRLNPLHVGMIREALGRARPALDEARKLADMPEGRYPIAWSADFDSTLCPWTDAIYSARPLLEFDGLIRSQNGDPDGALHDARAVLNVGRSIGEEPFFYGPANRMGCRYDAVKAIERTLAQGQPSEAALTVTEEAVRGEDAVSLSLLYFRGYRASMQRFLDGVDDGKHRLSELG